MLVNLLSPSSPQLPYRRSLFSRFSPTSSSDIAPSVDESLESGPLSDLQSEEDEGRRSVDRCLQLTVPPGVRRGGASMAQQLLEDIQSQDKDPDVWKKIEVRTSCLSLSQSLVCSVVSYQCISENTGNTGSLSFTFMRDKRL